MGKPLSEGYRVKNNKEYIGYLCHATETCNTDNPVQIITDVETTKNNIDDSVTGVEILKRVADETDLETLINDGGYQSPEASAEAEKLNVQVHATAIRGRKPKEDTLNSEEFSRDDTGFIEKCPNGKDRLSRKEKKKY